MHEDTHFIETLKVASYPKAQHHVIFLDEAVSDSSYYRNALLTLKTASQEDSVTIIINTAGGQVHTASNIVGQMRACAAPITGELHGEVCSAGTKIALACDEWVVGDDVIFMCHTTIYGNYASAEKFRDHATFMDKWVDNINRRTYEGFLTEDELVRMSRDGKEWWFDAETLKERLQKYADYRVKKSKSSMEDMFEEQNSQMDKYQNILLDMAIKEGKLTQQEVNIALKVQNVTEGLDETISDEELEALMKQEDVEKKDDTSELKVVTVMDTESEDWYLNCDLLLWYGDDMIGENDFAINLLSKQDIEYCNVFCQDEDDSSHTLKGFARGFGIKFSHNISDDKLHQKIIDFFQEKWDNQNKD